MKDEAEIVLKDVKNGDVVLFELKENPPFIFPITKNNLKENFGALVDKLIIFSEGSMITHAAMVYDSNKVVESTLPYVRIAPLMTYPQYNLHIRRVKSGKDGSVVLNYLPQTPKEIEENAESYAMMTAALAAISCLFKAKIKKNDNISLLTTIIRCVLYKVVEYLDNQKMPFSKGTENWFCSQLVYYAYTKAAADLKDSDYEITLENPSTPIDNTLIHYLINGNTKNLLLSDKLVLQKPAEIDNMFELADEFFNPEKKKAVNVENQLNKKPFAEDSAFILSFINMLFGKKIDFSNIENEMIKFQSAFVMPSDLTDCLAEAYFVKDEK